jgi:hypothetical protein
MDSKTREYLKSIPIEKILKELKKREDAEKRKSLLRKSKVVN